MATRSELLDWHNRLMAARFNGIREVRDSNGETITYRSGAELAAALNELERRMREIPDLRPSTIYMNTSKMGLN